MSRNVDFSHPQVPGRSSLRHALAALCLALVALLLATSPGQAQDAAPAVDPAVTDPAAPAAVTGTNIAKIGRAHV